MTIDEASTVAAEAQRKRDENINYQPTLDELKAIDLVLIEQARVRISGASGYGSQLIDAMSPPGRS